MGAQRHLRFVHALDVHARPSLEPAESGQQVPHGRTPHPGCPFRSGNRGGCPHPFRDLCPSGLEAVSAGTNHSTEFLGLQRRAPGYFAAAEIAARDRKVSIIIIEVARPDFPVADRSGFADPDLTAAAKGLYVIRDFAPGKPRHGYVIVQGASSTVHPMNELPRLEAAGINVKLIAAISDELLDRQSEDYRGAVLPPGPFTT